MRVTSCSHRRSRVVVLGVSASGKSCVPNDLLPRFGWTPTLRFEPPSLPTFASLLKEDRCFPSSWQRAPSSLVPVWSFKRPRPMPCARILVPRGRRSPIVSGRWRWTRKVGWLPTWSFAPPVGAGTTCVSSCAIPSKGFGSSGRSLSTRELAPRWRSLSRSCSSASSPTSPRWTRWRKIGQRSRPRCAHPVRRWWRRRQQCRLGLLRPVPRPRSLSPG